MSQQPSAEEQHRRTLRKLNLVAKWRVLFTGWQTGTRSDTDPTAAAIRDHREATLMLRAESTALVSLLIGKGIITGQEWDRALEMSADQLLTDLTARFPGVTADDDGLTMDPNIAVRWMRERHWPL